MSQKLSQIYLSKLFKNSKCILKTAFFYVKKYKLEYYEKKIKNIIVISKKCGKAILRNYIRRITRDIMQKHKYENNENFVYIVIFEKKKLDNINYKLLFNLFS